MCVCVCVCFMRANGSVQDHDEDVGEPQGPYVRMVRDERRSDSGEYLLGKGRFHDAHNRSFGSADTGRERLSFTEEYKDIFKKMSVYEASMRAHTITRRTKESWCVCVCVWERDRES